jgi:pyridoxal phosphate enzyme (YggS family)
MTLPDNLLKIKQSIKQGIRIVVVSKTQPAQSIRELYDSGHRIFGENKAQELINKHPQLPSDIEWHFIGHLQTNKVKQVVSLASVIQSIDSIKLFREIVKEAQKQNKSLDCLLQFHIATEETKFGLDETEAAELIDSEIYRGQSDVRITGVMGMATFTTDETKVRMEFRKLKQIFDHLKDKFFRDKEFFRDISMGMSGDYHIAIEEGSTIIRIGTAIFGERHYE